MALILRPGDQRRAWENRGPASGAAGAGRWGPGAGAGCAGLGEELRPLRVCERADGRAEGREAVEEGAGGAGRSAGWGDLGPGWGEGWVWVPVQIWVYCVLGLGVCVGGATKQLC